MEKKYLELNDFKFKDRFLDITEAQFGQALQIVNAQFSGVYGLWGICSPSEAQAKRELCINYLVAWKLMEMYPESAVDASGMGAIPLTMKRAGSVLLRYKNTVRQDNSVLELLTTNEYGINALNMIQSAPENFMLWA